MQQDSPQAAPPVQPAPPSVPPPPAPAPPLPQPQQSPQAPVRPETFYHPAQPETYAPATQDHFPGQTPPAPVASDTLGTITWEASEYVHNEKGATWLIGFVVVVILLVAVAIWLSAWTFALIIVVMGVAMGFFAFRQPHILRYSVSDEGILIGEKVYPYHDFRAFGVLEDGAFYTMTFIPVKRFSPALNIYFAEDQGDKIVDLVGAHLPMQDLHPDVIDKIMRRLRF